MAPAELGKDGPSNQRAPWVALVGPEVEENLSLRYLAAALAREGVASEIVPFNHPHELQAVATKLLISPQPLLVAISLAFQWRAMDMLGLVVELRRRGYRGHINAGGHFGTFAWREILRDFPEIDSLCRFEAEETLTELTKMVLTRQSLDGVAGLALRDPQGEPTCTTARVAPLLSALPWPDRRGEPAICLGHRLAPLVASRGCYAKCAFCCISAWHELQSPGRRFRARTPDEVTDEMAWLKRKRSVDVFIFHDDNFFLPGRSQSLRRVSALADALERRRLGRVATVVKARPPDITPEICRTLRDRFGLIRLFLGVETNTSQGLVTLGRRVRREQNQQALDILAEHGIYVCFNLLIFDPDTTLEGLEENLAFMEAHADIPFNFGRVELYAGTPLLARMQAEGRCSGDYLGRDYSMANPAVQRVFELATRCFYRRNFAPGAAANRLMATRFDVEVCRFFHPQVFREEWLDEAKALSSYLALDSIAGLRKILDHVDRRQAGEDQQLAEVLCRRFRTREDEILAAASALEERVQVAVGARCKHGRTSAAGENTPLCRRCPAG